MKVKKIKPNNPIYNQNAFKRDLFDQLWYLRTVKDSSLKWFISTLILIGFFTTNLQAQLGFCTGSSGDPIFTEDFGNGLTDGPALPAGTTTYDFTTGTPSDGD